MFVVSLRAYPVRLHGSAVLLLLGARCGLGAAEAVPYAMQFVAMPSKCRNFKHIMMITPAIGRRAQHIL